MMAPTTIVISLDPKDRKLLEGLTQDRNVTRERDRLRMLAELALAKLELISCPSAMVKDAICCLQDGLNATPLDSPEGTAGGQEYEDRRRAGLGFGPLGVTQRERDLQERLDRHHAANLQLIADRDLAHSELTEVRRVRDRLSADLVATKANLELARDREADQKHQLAAAKQERSRLEAAIGSGMDRQPHMFISTGAQVNGIGAGDDAYCDVCRNGPLNAIHHRGYQSVPK